MKYFIIFLLVFNSIITLGQKHTVSTDIGIPFSRFNPGASVTYNINFIRHLGFGLGLQVYDYNVTRVNSQYTPAIYADLRFNIRPNKANQFFTFLNSGINLYKHNNYYWREAYIAYHVEKDNGYYFGLGIGYFRRITKTGRGAYVSLKLISNTYKTDAINLISTEKSNISSTDATLVASVGYKF